VILTTTTLTLSAIFANSLIFLQNVLDGATKIVTWVGDNPLATIPVLITVANFSFITFKGMVPHKH
jgi:hypothetical protein